MQTADFGSHQDSLKKERKKRRLILNWCCQKAMTDKARGRPCPTLNIGGSGLGLFESSEPTSRE